jgi:hypothetical protein
VTANQLFPASAANRPLSAFIDATQHAVQEVLDVAEPQAGYKAIARLSGHLAAMWRAVYPSANGQPGADGPLRAVCLSRAREVERTLRLLECQLSGAASAAGLPVTVVFTLLAQHLASYRSAEQTLVTWVEDRLATEGREKLAREYRHALSRAPTRPHPRCPRSGPLCHVAFWLRSCWDRLLDTVDARPGVGHDFLVQLPHGRPASSGDENSRA